MITILSITLNRDEGLRKMLQSVKDHMTGEYVVIIANCSDDKASTDSVISEFGFALSFHLDRKTSIHESYNILIGCVETEYWCWLADDLTLEQDLFILLPQLDRGYDMIALPMKDRLTYYEKTHEGMPLDRHGCNANHHHGRRFANHALVKTSVWEGRLNTTPEEQVDYMIHEMHKNAYWPAGVYVNHVRDMDETRINRIL